MKRLTFFVGTMLFVACTGSTNYYIVKDNTTGQTYFATELKTLDNGAIKLRDAKTQTDVTLATSSVQQVSKDEYTAKLYGPPASAPAATPQTTPAAAPQTTPAAAPAPATTPPEKK
jgi:hypothetical protein